MFDMRKLYFLLLLSTVATNAQSFLWLQSPDVNLALNPDLVGYCVAVDQSDNVYAAGFKDNAYPYNDIFGDVFFNKYDTAGQPLFSKTFTGRLNVYAMEADNAGNVYMDIGYISNATIGTLVLSTVNQGIQPLLVKFDADGNVLWHYTPSIGGSTETRFRTFTVDSSGQVYLGMDNFMNSYIVKMSADGVPLMTIAQTKTHLLNSIDTDIDGNIYAAGSCADPNSTFAGVTVSTDFSYNDWVVKYSPAGVYQWMQYVEDITCSLPQVRATTPDNVYFTSDLYGSYAFGSLTAEGPAQGLFNDFFLAKLNAAGQFEWLKEVVGVGAVDHGGRTYLTTDSQDNVCFVGKTRGTVDWGNGVTTTAQGFVGDVIALKFDSGGNLLMAKTAGGTADDRIDSAVFNNSNEIVVSGMGRGSGTFDALTHEGTGSTPYAFVAKISGPLLDVDGHQLATIQISPNPVVGSLNILNLAQSQKAIILDTLGQDVFSGFCQPGQSLDVSALSKGVYLLKLENCKAVKFVKD
ncbi:MAG: T9SS type A sorting domain-containing protein [Flavobacterium sp.]|nr:MAG: T9SS type A sorting domain-containing protein [Flavobacterium sp.]